MVATSKLYKAELRNRIRVLRNLANQAVANHNKEDAITCSAMLEDVERDVNELRASTATAKFKTTVDYKRFIKRRAQADSENLLGWSKKEAKASGISFMATLYKRHLKDLGKSNTNFLKIALSVMQAYVETPMAVSAFMFFIEGLADESLPIEQVLLRTSGGDRGVAFEYIEFRIRANCRTNTAVNSKDAPYCPKRLLREIKSGGYGTCQSTKEIVAFLAPIFLYLTQPRNPFTLHEWDYIFDQKLTADGDHNVRALAACAGLSPASVNTVLLTQHLRPAKEPEMILSGGFLRVLSQGKPDEKSMRQAAPPGAPAAAAGVHDAQGGFAPAKKAYRSETSAPFNHDREPSRDTMAKRVREAGICRYCGNRDHPNLFADALKSGGKKPTECPYYKTSPEYSPSNIWAFATNVLDGRASAMKERRKIDGKIVPLP
jgi:hypothetical protein